MSVPCAIKVKRVIRSNQGHVKGQRGRASHEIKGQACYKVKGQACARPLNTYLLTSLHFSFFFNEIFIKTIKIHYFNQLLPTSKLCSYI